MNTVLSCCPMAAVPSVLVRVSPCEPSDDDDDLGPGDRDHE